ncbi:MAG TPA: PilC/PilY family type IV pilus protein [Arenimonas sp.]|uniref:PilC/PilY family type IV pilus protein n=1 Tax=Arenimonas sp. TaxID=1872635 RepID=UPI002D7F6820|nr:PilC/PilY family type IV pilus protein [Arenimonas sp.]HEU0153016.1 PilC/PilY family type IV pilus protein [Arenimonas sp.]
MNSNTSSKSMGPRTAILAAFFSTLLAAPVGTVFAQSFPDYPLQTGAGNVEPNLMFILDDSGSMSFEDMPNPDVTTICRRASNGSCADGLRITDQAYVGNTVYYNPATSYRPWQTSTGALMTGGTTMRAVFGSLNFAGTGYGNESDTLDLTDTGDCETYDRNGSNVTLCGGVQVFHVPRDTSDTSTNYLRNASNYYRYEVHHVSGTPYIVRSELVNGGGPGIAVGGFTLQSYSRNNIDDNDGTAALNHYFTLPAGGSISARTSDGSGRVRLRLYDPSGTVACVSDGGGTTHLCTATNTAAGQWRVELSRNNFDNVDLDVEYTVQNSIGCGVSTGVSWGNCTLAQPVAGRTQAQELENYATWFSYHRTRMKIAKAGSSEAFNQLGDNVRVGYRSIWNRNNFNIPVGDGNNGQFEGTSRDTWFARLFGAQANNGTPLRAALYDTGEYFSDSSSTGPYGPAATTDQLECRQNFAILTTDGFWNGNIGTRTIADQDGQPGASILNPADGSDVVRYTRVHPFRDTNSATNWESTLADVAMKYWKTDLRPDQDNIIPTSADNPAFWQHMVTFGISIGLKGTVDQTSVAQVLRDGRPRINGNPVDWPNPTDAENAERIDDLLHAAVNGRGDFIAATSADKFREAITSVLGLIQARLASGSNVATNSSTFQSDTRAYQATYRSGIWTGDLVARDVTAAGGISASEAWRVSARIAATYADAGTTNDFHNRTVLTWGGSPKGAAFPTTAQTALLARASGSAPVTGAANASYIKGLQTGELSAGGVLRNRSSVLGDIINSSPVYTRDTETLYVGANDGMLHAIDALTGNVVFSYVPKGINWAKLNSISDPAYTHGFFVDGPVALSTNRLQANTNYLVGTLGRGGKGVFGLDVSDPDSFANANVLWDNTGSTDADMGHVLGLPLIVRGNNDAILAIVPNGIDSTSGDAVLYIYNMTSGVQLAKINALASTGNGLSSPRAADLNGDGKVDYVYAGDLLGNIWKFDLTSNNPASWAVALGGAPLFTATDSGGTPQPITGGLALARESGYGRVWLTFGTGRLISFGDLSSTSVQSWYGLIDDDTAIADGRDDLVVRDIAQVGTLADGRVVRAFEAASPLPANVRGWVVDLDDPTAGERVVSGPRINGRAAFISSIIPSVGNGCEAGGSGFLNAIDVFTGTSPADGGGTGSSSFFDIDGDGNGNNDTIGDDGLPVGSLDPGVGMPTESAQIDDLILICGSNGQCTTVPASPQAGDIDARRLQWRELIEED